MSADFHNHTSLVQLPHSARLAALYYVPFYFQFNDVHEIGNI